MTIVLALFLLFGLFALGAPVGFSIAITGAVGLYLIGGMDMMIGVLQTAPVSAISNYELITLPMFILMAEFIVVSGIADELFTAAAGWFGRVRGGLAMATAVAGAGFASICGTSTASAATLASTSIPAMIRQGYEPKLAAGVVAISGTLAMLIPPSLALILYGLIAGVSIGKLFIGGIVPGFIVAFTIVATVYLLVRIDPSRAPGVTQLSFREKIQHLRTVLPVVLLIGCVSGTLYMGIATPTEASGIGAFGAFLTAIAKRRLTLPALRQALKRATYNTCMILMIVMGAHIFSYFIALTGVTQAVLGWVGTLGLPPILVVFLVLLLLILLGMFLDLVAVLVLTVPVLVPLITSLGYDPVWFGVLMIVTAEVGMLTPPVGMNCFVVAQTANRSIVEVFHGVLPHIWAHLIVIALLAIFPIIILWLPSRM